MGDVLRLGGFLVNPAEIEDHLQAHPAIDAAQVVAASTEKATRPVAFVVLAAGQTLDEVALRAHCEALAVYKRPVRFVALEAFPVTESANGMKIQRVRLRDLAQDLLRDALA